MIKRYDLWGMNYSKGYYNLETTIGPSKDFNGLMWNLHSNNKDGKIIFVKGRENNATFNYTTPVLVTSDGEYGAALTRPDHTFLSNWAWQKFSFNKATGKKIILKDSPADNYPGSGAFTLVNGVITTEKLSQSSEWLGFLGKDLEATIDLGNKEIIHTITLNVLKQEGSWIYPPSSVDFLISDDGINFKSLGILKPGEDRSWPDDRRIVKTTGKESARFIKIIAKNYGIIPDGQAGAGTPAWLFADEIEVQ